MRTPEQVAGMSGAELRATIESGPVEQTVWGQAIVRLSEPDAGGWFYAATLDGEMPGYGTFSSEQVARTED
jgi:hypothetical protein